MIRDFGQLGCSKSAGPVKRIQVLRFPKRYSALASHNQQTAFHIPNAVPPKNVAQQCPRRSQGHLY
jgi:hypothetical protein